VRCSQCELRVACLGGSICLHPDKSSSWGMAAYLISVSLLASTFISGLFYWFDPDVVTKKYVLLTWISGSFWTLLTYYGYYWYRYRVRKRKEEEKSRWAIGYYIFWSKHKNKHGK